MKTLLGHKEEIVCLSFDPIGISLATGSMDHTTKLWDIETGKILHNFKKHTGEIVSLDFSQNNTLITGSFDKTAKVSH